MGFCTVHYLCCCILFYFTFFICFCELIQTLECVCTDATLTATAMVLVRQIKYSATCREVMTGLACQRRSRINCAWCCSLILLACEKNTKAHQRNVHLFKWVTWWETACCCHIEDNHQFTEWGILWMTRCTVFTFLERCSRNRLLQVCFSLADILRTASLPALCRPRTISGGPQVGPRRPLRQCPWKYPSFFPLWKKKLIIQTGKNNLSVWQDNLQSLDVMFCFCFGLVFCRWKLNWSVCCWCECMTCVFHSQKV